MRLRIAPSPTGNLHIGTLRTTLFNWILAKKNGGQLVLRIEDTDTERSKTEFEKNIIEGIRWMQLDPDEGPEQGGPYAPYRQSERMKSDTYQAVAHQLVTEKKAYYCFCTDDDLTHERELAQQQNKPYVYSRKCTHLTETEITSRLAKNEPATIRFKIPEGPAVEFQDLIRETITFDRHLLSDFVLMKSDGSPSYNFAVVVDDHAMAISHVVRGEDHISNTPRQLLLFEAIGTTPPQYAHLPMILGPDRSKLSKRHGATSVTEYRDLGYLPEAVFNYLVLLGWSSPDGQEVVSKEHIISQFSLDRISKSGAIFDLTKLKWMNGQYIRQLEANDLVQRLLPFLSQENKEKIRGFQPEQVTQMMVSLQDNLDVLTDINAYLPLYLYTFEEYTQYVDSLAFSDQDLHVIQTFLESLSQSYELFTPAFVDSLLQSTLDHLKLGKGKVLKPIRCASSGVGSGPHLPDFLSIIGREQVQKRLGYVLSQKSGS